jgi:hypothetical protein
LERCEKGGKHKERFVSSHEALGLQNVKHSISHGNARVESTHGQTIARPLEGVVNLPLLGEMTELVNHFKPCFCSEVKFT